MIFLSYFPSTKSTVFVNAKQNFLIDLGNDFSQNATVFYIVTNLPRNVFFIRDLVLTTYRHILFRFGREGSHSLFSPFLLFRLALKTFLNFSGSLYLINTRTEEVNCAASLHMIVIYSRQASHEEQSSCRHRRRVLLLLTSHGISLATPISQCMLQQLHCTPPDIIQSKVPRPNIYVGKRIIMMNRQRLFFQRWSAYPHYKDDRTFA